MVTKKFLLFLGLTIIVGLIFFAGNQYFNSQQESKQKEVEQSTPNQAKKSITKPLKVGGTNFQTFMGYVTENPDGSVSSGKYEVGRTAVEMFRKIPKPGEKEDPVWFQTTLVQVSALIKDNEEALKLGITSKDLYAAAASDRLGICPQNTAHYLSLLYKDQPEGEVLFVATKPIEVDSAPHLFQVSNLGKKLILGTRDVRWFKNDLFIFCTEIKY